MRTRKLPIERYRLAIEQERQTKDCAFLLANFIESDTFSCKQKEVELYRHESFFAHSKIVNFGCIERQREGEPKS